VATPTLASLSPATAPTGGGDLVRLAGTNFGPGLEMPSVASTASSRRCTPRAAPPSPTSERPLNAAGQPIPGEVALLSGAYRFERPTIAREADLTRVVRQLLRS